MTKPTEYQWVSRCPEQDSNLHTVTGTSPSSWRVYQFHHLGDLLLAVANILKKFKPVSGIRKLNKPRINVHK